MTVEERRLRLWQGRVETDVEIAGKGPPLLYLHGPWGLRPDRDFIARLAETHTVYAPRHPGGSRGRPNDVHQIDNWWDLMVYYGELLDALKLAAPAVVGHSFGGMVAAEIAATLPAAVGRLVLIDPVGLWRDERPVRNWMIMPDAERPGAFFADPHGATAKRFFGPPDDPAQRVEAMAGFVWAQACTGKFVWPIPDRGLKKHIHRIAAPTLIVWGKADGVIAPAYADDFAAGIKVARVVLIGGAAHLPHLEQPDAVVKAVHGFLGNAKPLDAKPRRRAGSKKKAPKKIRRR
jgi:pimeloyl-ACP methyl ester carboxylesterase